MLEPIQVKGLCGEDIQQLLRDRLDATGALVIFTDLQAGSCTMAARRLLREASHVLLVSGTNLPMLLDFVMSSAPSPHDAAHASVERARSAIAAFGGPA
jgi:PTS system N-acetylgalactosamine-specific IIA component